MPFYCQCSADAAANQNERAYAEIVQMADKSRCAVKETISVQEKAATSRAEALVDQLEKEICELKMGEDKLKQLSHTEDHVNFLQVRRYKADRSDSAVVRTIVGVVFLF